MHVISQKNLDIDEVVEVLKSGATIVYPTETCYGLGCDATNEAAVQKIFAIKGREIGKSALMVASDIEMVKQYVEWNDIANKLAEKYWSPVVRPRRTKWGKPGALTMVLSMRGPSRSLAEGVISKDGTAAFRVTSHPFAHALAKVLGRPIVSTSANIAGGPNPYMIEAILEAFEKKDMKPDIVIDAGELPKRPPSTIIRIVYDKTEVIRQVEIKIIF